MRYRYKMSGTTADDQSWETSGIIYSASSNFPALSEIALRESFMALTEGRAVFGKPGVGCRGPYRIKNLTLDLED